MATSAEFRELVLHILKQLGDGGREELCFLYFIDCDKSPPSAVQTAKALEQRALLVVNDRKSLNDFKKKLESLNRSDLGDKVDGFTKKHFTQNEARPPPRDRDPERQTPDGTRQDSDDADDTEGGTTANTTSSTSNSTTGTTRHRSSSEGNVPRVENILRQRACVPRTRSSPGMVEHRRPSRSQGASRRSPTPPPIQEEERPGSDSDGDNKSPDTILESLESYSCTVEREHHSDAAYCARYEYLQADNTTMRIGQGGAQEVQQRMIPHGHHHRDPGSLIGELASSAARVDVSIRIEHKGKKL